MSESSGFLIDTSVLSAWVSGRPPVLPRTTLWMQTQADAGRLHLSVVTVAEIQRGIRKLARSGATSRVTALSKWLQGLVEVYGDRILAIDTNVALVAGEIEDDAKAEGKNPGFADVLIAATAKAHGLAVLTAKLRHFQPLGVECFDPIALTGD